MDASLALRRARVSHLASSASPHRALPLVHTELRTAFRSASMSSFLSDHLQCLNAAVLPVSLLLSPSTVIRMYIWSDNDSSFTITRHSRTLAVIDDEVHVRSTMDSPLWHTHAASSFLIRRSSSAAHSTIASPLASAIGDPQKGDLALKSPPTRILPPLLHLIAGWMSLRVFSKSAMARLGEM